LHLVDRSRPQSARRPGLAPREDASSKERPASAETNQGRECPWCGSRNTKFFKRGLTGLTDERDQYITCNQCGRLTYEIVSRTNRDLRVGQFRAGGTFRDNARQTKYTISRVLKVGLNEVLLYLKPVLNATDEPR
jgi:hypothetical protein